MARQPANSLGPRITFRSHLHLIVGLLRIPSQEAIVSTTHLRAVEHNTTLPKLSLLPVHPSSTVHRKEPIMKSLIVTLALASANIGSFAAEYTNFDIPSGSSLSRAEVRAQAASRILGRDLQYVGDAAVFQNPMGSTLTRAEAASRVLGRTVIFNEATTFVDAAPTDADTMRVLARSMK
jgi:hypothetical protein